MPFYCKVYKKHGLHLLKVESLYNLHYVQGQPLVAHWASPPQLVHHQRPLAVLVELAPLQAWLIGEKCQNHQLGRLKFLAIPVEDEMQEEEAEGVGYSRRRMSLEAAAVVEAVEAAPGPLEPEMESPPIR